MRKKILPALLAGILLVGCQSPPPTSTNPTTSATPATPAMAPAAKVVAVDAEAAKKDLQTADGMAGFDEAMALEIPASTQESVDLGKQSFANKCAPCHGDSAAGGGPAAVALDPKPRNLTKSTEYKYGHLELATFRTVRWGVANTGMAPWEEQRLDDKEAWAVVHYVRGLQQ